MKDNRTENNLSIKKAKPIILTDEMCRYILAGTKSTIVIPVKDGALEKMPYMPGDILYVKEKIKSVPDENNSDKFKTIYRAEHLGALDSNWLHPRYMPKEDARIFLEVAGILVNRVQDLTVDDIRDEGFTDDMPEKFLRILYANAYDEGIAKEKLPEYGWNANPLVWIIMFDVVSKPEDDKI